MVKLSVVLKGKSPPDNFHKVSTFIDGRRNRSDHRRRTCDDYFPNSLRPISYLGYICRDQTKVFCRKNSQIHFTSAKMMLIVWPKIPQMPQKCSAQFVYPSPKVWDIIEKWLYRASLVCGSDKEQTLHVYFSYVKR